MFTLIYNHLHPFDYAYGFRLVHNQYDCVFVLTPQSRKDAKNILHLKTTKIKWFFSRWVSDSIPDVKMEFIGTPSEAWGAFIKFISEQGYTLTNDDISFCKEAWIVGIGV